jgi:hypothetical protein
MLVLKTVSVYRSAELCRQHRGPCRRVAVIEGKPLPIDAVNPGSDDAWFSAERCECFRSGIRIIKQQGRGTIQANNVRLSGELAHHHLPKGHAIIEHKRRTDEEQGCAAREHAHP